MAKNLLDDVIDDSNLKKRYKDQNKQFQHEQKIAEIDSVIVEYNQRKPKDVSWADDYNNFYDTQKRINAALLDEIINGALFEKLKVTADNVIALALEKQEKEAKAKLEAERKKLEEKKRLAELKLEEERIKKEEQEKKNKIEHEKRLAALEREKELAKIKAEKDRIEAQAAAKIAQEQKEREEKEKARLAAIAKEKEKQEKAEKAERDRLLAIEQEKALDEKIKELDALILTLGKKKPNNFWCDDVKNVSAEVKRIPTKKRIQFSNLQKLEELNQIVKIYEDESELNDKLTELMSVSRHTKDDLAELDKTLNLIENCKKTYFFQNFNPEKLRHEKIQLVYADHFETLKRILSTPKKEYASIVDDFYAESVDFVPKVDFEIDDFIPGFTKKWDNMYKIVKKISDKEKDKDNKKKVKGKASTKKTKTSKKEKAPAGTKFRPSALCYVFFFLTLVIGGAAFVFELFYAAEFFPFLVDYLIYIEAGTAFLSVFFMLLCAKRVANFLVGLLFMAIGTALVYLPFNLTLVGYSTLLATSIAMFLNYTSFYYRNNNHTIYTVLNTTMGVLPFFLASFKVFTTYVPAGLLTNLSFVGIGALLFITLHMDLTKISYDTKFVMNLIFGLISSLGSIAMAFWAFNVASTDPIMYFTAIAIAGMCYTHMIVTCCREEEIKGVFIGVTIGVVLFDAIWFCTVIPQLIA